MDAEYLKFHSNPSAPKFRVPAGAVDAHCHVFGPEKIFPYHPSRKYTPCDAPCDSLFALRDFLGFERNVIVQASCHGTNNAALLDALQLAGDRARGVAVVRPDISDSALQDMHTKGVRAVRFNFVKRLVDIAPEQDFINIARKIRKLGWHIVVYIEAHDLDGITPLLERFGTKVVIDHMGRPDVSNGINHIDFQKFISLLDKNKNFWTKVSCPERLTCIVPKDQLLHYADVIPFASLLVNRFPGRVLWGTDWPHPNMQSHVPDDGHLVDFIPKIAPSAQLQHKLLVENPMRLYWPEENT